MFKNKKVILGGTVVVALAVVMAGTFAWFTDGDEVVNKMKLARFDVKITEEWDEEDNQNLQPNEEVDKVVRVTNNGSANAVVRVKLDETLRLFETEPNKPDELKIYWENAPIENNDDYVVVPDYVMPDGATLIMDENVGSYYTTITSLKDENGNQCYVAFTGRDGLARYNPTTGKIEYAYYKYATDTVADTEDYFKPVLNTTDWTKKDDGYYYYNKVLESGKVTTPLFEKVKVSPELPNKYIGAIYHLTPKMEAVQATYEAVKGTWGEDAYLASWNLPDVPEE